MSLEALQMHLAPTAETVGARPKTWLPSAQEIGTYSAGYIDDLLADKADIQALVPQWIYPALDAGVGDAGQYFYVPRYGKSGNVVTVSGLISSWGDRATLFTLPEGYRPERTIGSIQIVASNSGWPETYTTMVVNSTGLVELPYIKAGTGWLFFHVTYVVK